MDMQLEHDIETENAKGFMSRGLLIGRRRFIRDGRWIRDGGFLIGKQQQRHTTHTPKLGKRRRTQVPN